MEYVIRLASPDDVAAVSLVATASFLETYHSIIPGADILAFCEAKHNPAQYAAWLREPGCVVWLAESTMGAPIGYLLMIPASLPERAPVAGDLEVLRIYVLHPFHKAGVGHALMDRAVREAAARGAGRLVLGMNERNERALAFYRRQGFEVIGTRAFMVGNTVCKDLVLSLATGAT